MPAPALFDATWTTCTFGTKTFSVKRCCNHFNLFWFPWGPGRALVIGEPASFFATVAFGISAFATGASSTFSLRFGASTTFAGSTTAVSASTAGASKATASSVFTVSTGASTTGVSTTGASTFAFGQTTGASSTTAGASVTWASSNWCLSYCSLFTADNHFTHCQFRTCKPPAITTLLCGAAFLERHFALSIKFTVCVSTATSATSGFACLWWGFGMKRGITYP